MPSSALAWLQEHWLALRKIHGRWWNFNSLFPAPQQLSQFYLSVFLATLREQGYSIFVVHGGLPTYPDTSVTGDQGIWLTEAQVLLGILRLPSQRAALKLPRCQGSWLVSGIKIPEQAGWCRMSVMRVTVRAGGLILVLHGKKVSRHQ